MANLVVNLILNDKFTKRFAAATNFFIGQQGRIGKSVKAVAGKVLNLRNILAGFAAVQLGKQFAGAAADFEASMSKITGLVGVAADEVEQFSNQILKLGPEVGKGPRELADAMFFITSAGLEGAAALEALEASAKASAAGLGATETVADAVTSAVNAYGPSVLNAAAATDVLVATVREGKAPADQIAGALGSVLPVASEFGVSFDQVGASIAAMTRLGANAAESATALRSVITGLLKPSEDGEKALNAVGLSFEAVRRQVKEEGLLAALRNVKGAFGDNQTELARVIPNVRALTGVLNLAGKNADEAQKIFDSMRDSTGALDAAFEAAATDAAFGFDQIRASVEVVAIKFGDFINSIFKSGLGEFIQTTFKVFSDMLGDVGDGLDESGDRAEKFAQVAITALKGVIKVAAGVADVVNLMFAGFREVQILLLRDRTLFNLQSQLNDVNEELEEQFRTQGKANAETLAAKQRLQALITEKGKELQALRSARTEWQNTKSAVETVNDVFLEVETRIKNNAAAAEAAAKAQKEMADATNKNVEAQERLKGMLADQRTPLQVLKDEVTEFMNTPIAERTVETGQALADFQRRFQALGLSAMDARRAAQGFTTEIGEKMKTRAKVGTDELDKLEARVKALPPEIRAVAQRLQEIGELDIVGLEKMAQHREVVRAWNREVEEINQQRREKDLERERASIEKIIGFYQTGADTISNISQAAFGAIQQFVGEVVDEVFEGNIQTIQDVGAIAKKVLLSLIKTVITELVKLAIQATITKAVASAQGNVLAGGIGNLQAFQTGGLVKTPTIGLIGEGGQNEAVVPLPDGRNIPVRLAGPGGGAGTGGQVQQTNINISAVDARSFQQLMTTPEGREAFESMIAQSTQTNPKMRKVIKGDAF